MGHPVTCAFGILITTGFGTVLATLAETTDQGIAGWLASAALSGVVISACWPENTKGTNRR